MYLFFSCTRWYRGIIISCRNGMNEIFFLDYGDTEWINSDDCYELPKDMLEVMSLKRIMQCIL